MITHNALLQLLQQNYFSILDIYPSFDINLTTLAITYRNKQNMYHPDKTLQLDKNLQELIIAVSAHINNAFARLKNPLSRSLLLLELNNTPLDFTKDTTLPPEFILEQMEFYEALNDAKQSSKDLHELEQILLNKEQYIIEQLSNAFSQHQYNSAQNLTKQLAFYQKILNNIDNSISLIR